MTRKAVLAILLALQLVVVLFALFNVRFACAAKTWYVNDDGGADFTKIQDAINAASLGDTIYVYNGTYNEYVTLNKSLSLIGENKHATIINGTSSQAVLEITANNTQVNGFTIQNGLRGIFVSASNGSTISNNNVTRNDEEGLRIEDSANSTIYGNLISFNSFDGVYAVNTKNTFLQGNTIAWNIDSNGVTFENVSNADIDGNTISNNTGVGISFLNSDHVSVVRSTMSSNYGGVGFINLTSSIFYHNNFVNHTVHVLNSGDSPNTWDNGVEGNYWDDYNGTDFKNGLNQNLEGSDGIGDTPYEVVPNNQDNYPLMGPLSIFDAGVWNSQTYSVNIASNSTVSEFNLDRIGGALSFQVGGQSGGVGFSRVSVPNAVVLGLWQGRFEVLVDGVEHAWTKWMFGTQTYIYFTYAHSQHEVVIQTLETESPFIWILSPENRSYTSSDVALTFTLDEPTSWIGYSLDDQANVTINGNTTLTGLNDGAHWVTVFANDTAGNMGYSDPLHFSVDTLAPVIVVNSPQSTTYTTNTVSLSVSVSEPTSWIGFSLDEQANQTISGTNTVISDLSDGAHNIIVYANDTAGNTGVSERVYFTISTQSGSQQGELFPMWIAVAVAITAVAVVAVFVYFVKFRKKHEEPSAEQSK